jgi:transcriptional regulator with XRE-family HTH domain
LGALNSSTESMSALSHCLSQIVDQLYDGKQQDLATKAGVSPSLISRYLAGGYRPEPEKLESLCVAHTPEIRARIACAHLEDECPDSARYYVRIEPIKEDDSAQIKDSPTSNLEKLDRKTRKAVDFLIDLAMKDRDAREHLVSTARFLGAER